MVKITHHTKALSDADFLVLFNRFLVREKGIRDYLTEILRQMTELSNTQCIRYETGLGESQDVKTLYHKLESEYAGLLKEYAVLNGLVTDLIKQYEIRFNRSISEITGV